MTLECNLQNNVEFHALSFDYGFKELLVNSSNNNIGHVHSIFKKVINFLDIRNKMYSIVLKEVCNGPYTLRINNSQSINLQNLEIPIGEMIFLKNDEIILRNKLIVKLNDASLWIPRKLEITNEASENLKKNLVVYNNYLLLKGAEGGAKYFYVDKFIKQSKRITPSLIEKELCKRIGLLLDSIIFKENNLQQSVKSLIGFGNGLTPSGDDFLSGLNVFLYYIKIENKNFLLKEIKDILYFLKLSTTDVSRNMLYASMEGMAAEAILNFIEALLYKGEDMLIKAVKNLFAIGGSSGTDISVGIVTAARFSFDFLEMEGEI